MKDEIWKDIEGFSGYEVSNFGRVRSWRKKGPGGGKLSEPVDMKSSETLGYKHVSLYKDGKGYNGRIHRLVARAFIPNPKNKPQVNHIDFCRSNNHVDNLEWCTASENAIHDYKYNGRVSPYKKGEKHMNAKLSKEDVIRIKELLDSNDLTQIEIADQYPIDPSVISDIKRGKLWSHIQI